MPHDKCNVGTYVEVDLLFYSINCYTMWQSCEYSPNKTVLEDSTWPYPDEPVYHRRLSNGKLENLLDQRGWRWCLRQASKSTRLTWRNTSFNASHLVRPAQLHHRYCLSRDWSLISQDVHYPTPHLSFGTVCLQKSCCAIRNIVLKDIWRHSCLIAVTKPSDWYLTSASAAFCRHTWRSINVLIIIITINFGIVWSWALTSLAGDPVVTFTDQSSNICQNFTDCRAISHTYICFTETFTVCAGSERPRRNAWREGSKGRNRTSGIICHCFTLYLLLA